MATLTAPQRFNADAIDQIIWNNALPDPTKTNEWQLLRGLHNKSSLECLKSFLESVFPGQKVGLTSVWLDKTPQAQYTKGNNQKGNTEVADLLVYVRTRTPSKTMRRALLLQGKPIHKPNQSYGRGGATAKEEYLYEHCPPFSLHSHGGSVGKPIAKGTFDLRRIYRTSPSQPWATLSHLQTHWRFLSICRSQADYLKWAPASPFHTRWPVKSKAQGEGFSETIAELLSPLPTLGQPVDSINGADDWKRLVESLLAYTRSKVITWNGGTARRKRAILCRFLGTTSDAYFSFDPEHFQSTDERGAAGPLALMGPHYPLDSFIDQEGAWILLGDENDMPPPENPAPDGFDGEGGEGMNVFLVDVQRSDEDQWPTARRE